MWFGLSLSLFLQVELSHFSGVIYIKVNIYRIPSVYYSSYSLMHIIFKLHMCFGHGHGLKMCMWFGYNPQIILSLFFTGERGGLVVNASDSESRSQGFEPH